MSPAHSSNATSFMPTDLRVISSGLLALLLVVLTTLVHAPGLWGGFLLDDFHNLVENPAFAEPNRLRSTNGFIEASLSSPASDLRRPIAMGSFAAQVAVSGMNPIAMKTFNLIVHGLNGLLLFILLLQLQRALGTHTHIKGIANHWPLLVVALWLLAPVNQSSVLYVIQRMESLSHTFVFLALIGYAHGRIRHLQGQSGWLPIALGFGVALPAGLLTKESAALVPLYCLVMEAIVFKLRGQSTARRGLLALSLVFLVLPGIAGTIWLWPKVFGDGLYASRDFTLTDRLQAQPVVWWMYVKSILLPTPSAPRFYYDDLAIPSLMWSLLASAGLLAMVLAAWRLRDRLPLFSLGVAWFLCAHVLTGTVVPLELAFDHRNYFASAGLFLALASILVHAQPYIGRSMPALIAALALAQGAQSWIRANDWRDPVRHSIALAQSAPGSARAQYELARSLLVIGGFDPAFPGRALMLQSLERARSLPRASLMPETMLLLDAGHNGLADKSEWWAGLRSKIASPPFFVQDFEAPRRLVDCELNGPCNFSTGELRGLLEAALAAQPRSSERAEALATYLLVVGEDPHRAAVLFRDLVERFPEVPQYAAAAAYLLATQGEYLVAESLLSRLDDPQKFPLAEAARRLIDQASTDDMR